MICGMQAKFHQRVQWRLIKLVKDYILMTETDEVGFADIVYAPLA